MLNKNVEQKEPGADNLTVGAKGGAVAFGLKILATLLGFLNQIVLARVLGAGGIGEVILAITVVRISSQVAKFGMEEAMMKFVPLYIDQNSPQQLKGTISFALRFCLVFSAVFMLLVVGFSKFIAINIFHSEGLLILLPVIAIAIPAWVIRDVIGGILRGYHDTLRALIPESLISPFFRLGVFLILLIKGATPLYAVIAFVAGEVLAVITSIVLLQSRLREFKPAKTKCERRKILDIAFTIIFTSMSILLYTQADIWILGMYMPTHIVGIYGIAAKLVLLVYFPMMAFNAIIPPLISSIHASGNSDELKNMVSESTRWILSLALPIMLMLLFEGKFILKYAYGEEFGAGYTVLVILIAGQMIKAFAGLTGVILQMTGGHRIYMKINIIWGIINIVLNIIMVPRFGMIGAAAATAFSLSMVDMICIFVIYKRLSLLTLAKGFGFDIVFITVVAGVYALLSYSDFPFGHHLLLVAALTVYLWKSIVNHDIPWKLLTAKYRNG